MTNKWSGNFFETKEAQKEELEQDEFGNYISGNTYGQSNFTVRVRDDGKSDVYVKSDSSKGHSHDVIDEKGNLEESKHDYVWNKLSKLSNYEIQMIEKLTTNDYVKRSAKKILADFNRINIEEVNILIKKR